MSVTVCSMAGNIIQGPERVSRSSAVPELRLRLRRLRQLQGQFLRVRLFYGDVELGDNARLGADEDDIKLSATFSELTHDERTRMAREVVDLGVLVAHGFEDDFEAGGPPLNVELLACSIDFFARMCADELGVHLVRRKSKSELRNMMHGENFEVPAPWMATAELELESRLVRECFGGCGYYGLGYVFGAFLALELQAEQDMRDDPDGAIGPSAEHEEAWLSGSDYEWVETSPDWNNCQCLAAGGPLEPMVRRTTASGTVYPPHVWRGPVGQLPPVGCFLRVGSWNDTDFYSLRASMRIVLLHSDPSYGKPADVIKLGLPTHSASGSGIVDVRLSYEFAINPRGTPVDMPASEFTDAFFAGRHAQDLFLALVADVGARHRNEQELYTDRSVVVLALLRCSEFEHMHLHSKALMYHSSVLDPEAVRVCEAAFTQSLLLAHWRAFKLQEREDILTYSCLRQRPDDWPLIELPEARKRART